MPKIVNTALKAKAKATGPEAKAKAKAIKFGLEAPRGQGLASRTASLAHTECWTTVANFYAIFLSEQNTAARRV